MDFLKLINYRNGIPGFAKETGIVVTKAGDGYAEGEMRIDAMHGNPIGSVHGGAIFSLADTIGGVAATSKGSYVTTVSGNINYLNPAIGTSYLKAKTREVKAGKTIMVYDVVMQNDQDQVIAEARMTYYNLHREVEFDE